MREVHQRARTRSFTESKAFGIIVSLFCLLVLQWLDYQGWFAPFNGRLFNFILRSHATAPESAASKELYVVEIDSSAYKECFDSRSPMDPNRVMQLVSGIADADAKAIGVDIRTEGGDYRSLTGILNQYVSSVVWVSAFKCQRPHIAPFHKWLVGDTDYTAVTPLPVLGQEPFSLPNERQQNWGLPLYPRDEDGSVRRFPRTVHLNTTDVQGGGTAPSWATRVADVYCRPQCKAESADEVYISYAGEKPRCFRMLDLFSCAVDPSDSQHRKKIVPQPANWKKLNFSVRGRVVLVGGTFPESNDFYQTPKGELPGLIVNAYAVKAGLNGNGFEQLRQPLAWMLDLALGIVIILLCDEEIMRRLDKKYPNVVPGWKRKLIVSSSGIVFLICFSSLFVAKGRYLVGFAGEGAGVLIDRLRNLWEYTGRRKR